VTELSGKAQRDAGRLARRAEQQAAKEIAAAERDARKAADRERREAERQTQEDIASSAADRYVHVRDWALSWRDDYAAAIGVPSDDEQRLTRALAHVWDAPLETIASLRQACEPLGGARAANYDSREGALFPRLKREVFYLRKQLGPDLFVEEPRALGGFGFVEQTLLFNDDTARHFVALIALQDAAILPAFRDPGPRRVVWEFGGGWGGFAYQFTRICPAVTYVISGAPEQLLVSAVYLAAAVPEARCRLVSGAAATDPSGWDDADFVFVPGHLLASLRPPRLDLTLDLMTLRTMAGARAAAHVERSFHLGSRYLFAMRPGVATPADECVERAIERWYWPHPVPRRRDPRELAAAGGDPSRLPPPRFAHLAGWRRIRA
jgi:hypothetical protein